MKMRTIVTRTLAATALLMLPATGGAQEPGTSGAERGAEEGIAIHGHWTIEVIRGGELVERREFENALTNTGALFLVGTLARENTTGYWTILLLADGSGEVCSGDSAAGPACRMREFDSEVTLATPDTGDNAGSLVLTGSDTAVRAGNILDVNTLVQPCDPTVAPADCATAGTPRQLTRKVLDNSIAFANGDQINATVVLTFN